MWLKSSPGVTEMDLPLIAQLDLPMDAAGAYYMSIAIDGQLKEKSFSIDEISVTDVHGIEVYPGSASLPAEFGSIKPDGWCGLVMVWTRSR